MTAIICVRAWLDHHEQDAAVQPIASALRDVLHIAGNVVQHQIGVDAVIACYEREQTARKAAEAQVEELVAACKLAQAAMRSMAFRMSDAGIYGLPEDMRGGATPTAFQALRTAIEKSENQ